MTEARITATGRVTTKMNAEEFNDMTLSEIRALFKEKLQNSGFRLPDGEQLTLGWFEERGDDK